MDKDKLYRNIDVCEEVITYIDTNMEDVSKRNEQIELLIQLKKLTDSTYEELRLIGNQGLLLPNIGAAFGNISYSIERIINHKDKFVQIFKYDIHESLERMKMLTNCQYNIINSQENMLKERQRVENELKKLHNAPRKEYKYKVSIMVPAYNQLEYTKKTIESIYKYTDFSHEDVELITMNNGSSDGTEEYFESLPNEKKFSFKFNTLPLHISSQFYEGKYFVVVSNDVLVTPGWLELLWECLESADDIGMVVPTCNADSISELQGIEIPYANRLGNEEEVEDFAYRYNSHDCSRWEERSLLMPFVSMVRSDLWSLGIEDPCFIKGQFIDDNNSTFLRRTGWRMILAKNVFLHHYGSITFNKTVRFSYRDALEEMREVYALKWGVDPWNSRGELRARYYVPDILSNKKIRILWVEPRFGVCYTQVKNKFKLLGAEEIESVAVVLDEQYIPDADGLFDEVLRLGDIAVLGGRDKEGFDFIGFGEYIDKIIIHNSMDILDILRKLIKKDGCMVIPIMNYYNLICVCGFLREILESSFKNQGKYIDMDKFMDELEKKFEGNNSDFLSVYDGSINIDEEEGKMIKNIFASGRGDVGMREILRIFMWWMIVKA
ncbi:glycosyltransferase family A protein [Selenomonas ruminantium]|nr:glycosyltransferase family 2 protein [Selenomonas ruminantium]